LIEATCPIGYFLQFPGCQLKDGPGRTGGSPDFIILEKIFVDQDPNGMGMAHRGNTADGKACFCPYKISIGL
jgi:hypothetical protein